MLKIGSEYFKIYWGRFLDKMDKYWKNLDDDVKEKLLEAAEDLDIYWDLNLPNWNLQVEEKIIAKCNRILQIAKRYQRSVDRASTVGAID